MLQVVLYQTATHIGRRHIVAIGRNKAIGVFAKALGIGALKLNGEIGGTAIIYAVKPIGLTSGIGTDKNHLYINTPQPIDKGFTGRSRAAAGKHKDPRHVEFGQAGTLLRREPRGGCRKISGRQILPGNRINRGVLVVKCGFLKYAPSSCIARHHRGQLGGYI